MYIQVVWNLLMLYLTKLYMSVVLLMIFMYRKRLWFLCGSSYWGWG